MGFEDPGCTIFVRNVETRVTEEILWELFLQAGPLRNVKIPTDRTTGEPRGFAFVTYKDEVTVPYACELFNSIKLFKKSIYCNPSDRGRGDTSKGSINQSPQSTPGSPSSPTSSNNSLIQGLLNRSTPSTSTPYGGGKRKISMDDNDQQRGDGRYDGRSGDRNGMYREQSSGGRGNNDSVFRGDDQRGNDRSYNDRSYNNDRNNSSQGRYDRSNSYNSSYGNSSPMHMQAMSQSHRQYGRQGSTPRGGGGSGGGGDFRSPNGRDFQRGDSSFGAMRPTDGNRNQRRQRSQPY